MKLRKMNLNKIIHAEIRHQFWLDYFTKLLLLLGSENSLCVENCDGEKMSIWNFCRCESFIKVCGFSMFMKRLASISCPLEGTD